MKIAESISEKVAFHRQRSHRIEGLADGVFAIAMTLLVLDIHIPLGEINTEHDVWRSLIHLFPQILTFLIAFTFAGQFWISFINQFNYLQTADRNENVIAVFYLLFISMLPFSAAFMSRHLWSRVAVGCFLLNIQLISIMLAIHWLYSYHNGLVKVDGDQEAAIHKAVMSRARIALTSLGIVTVFCFFNSYLALGGIIFIQIMFTSIGFIDMLKKKKGN
jgi:uncharacterized membrane protein